jgi:phosphate transport system permease protein
MAAPTAPVPPAGLPSVELPLMPQPLRGRRLPRSALPVAAVAVLGVVLLLAALTDIQGAAGIAVLCGLGYLAAQTGLSLAVEGRRKAVDRLAGTLLHAAFGLAALPLALILWYVVRQGAKVVDLAFLTHTMFRVDPQAPGGGVLHAVVGTVVQALLTTAFTVPLGVLAAIYLTEYGRGRPFARVVSIFVDAMTGVPSIVAGLFVFTAWILVLGFQKSGLAGSLALSVVMLPVVIRATEAMLRLVPDDLRDAAHALGVSRSRTIVSVVMPTALGGIVTGVMLGVARIMGETAPLLLLVGINQRLQPNPFAGQSRQRAQESLPTLIFEQFGLAAGNTEAAPFQRAWGAALVLVLLIAVLNLAARFTARLVRHRPRRRGRVGDRPAPGGGR